MCGEIYLQKEFNKQAGKRRNGILNKQTKLKAELFLDRC